MLTARYVALEHDFSFDVPTEKLASFLDMAFAPLRRPGRAASVWTVRDQGPRETVRYQIEPPDGAPLHVEREDDLPLMLVWHINRLVCFQSHNHLLAHSAVVAWQDHAILLPARADAGKSTLAAGLVRAGFAYLSDEAAAIRPDGFVDPYPKAIALGRGSWSVVPRMRPPVPEHLSRYLADQWLVDPRDIRSGAIGARSMPLLVVSPRYEPGAQTSVEELSHAEGVCALAEQSFNLRRWGKRGLDLLARVVEGCRCYRLRHGDLDEAVDAIRALLPAEPATQR